MFEDMTFDAIMERCLARLPGNLDTREGSVIYDALAPAVAELAQFYITLSAQMDRAFPDTATGVDLTNKAKERSVFRLPATPAVRLGVFTDTSGAPMDVPIGSRFSGGSMNFAVTERTAAGAFKLTAEAAGEAGNGYIGVLFPIDHLAGLGSATLADVLIPGEDEESDADLRKRYSEVLHTARYGGNVADYIDWAEALPDVGRCKVYPAWQGGGTVRLVFTAKTGGIPSSPAVARVQEAVDPPGFEGQGKGFAPIDHRVTVAAATGRTVAFSMRLDFVSGYAWGGLAGEIAAALAGYLSECIDEWPNNSQVIVRQSRAVSAVLTVAGIADVPEMLLNGVSGNLTLQTEEIPVLGAVTQL